MTPSKKTLKFAAISCTHCPLEDPEAVEWVLKNLTALQPDVFVMLGDLHEASGASVHPHEDQFTLLEEYQAANHLLERIRKAVTLNGKRKCRLVLLHGNHDDNILAQCRISKQLRALCDFRLHEPELEHWEQPCEYIYDAKKGVFRVGPVSFTHGFETGQSAGKFQSFLLGEPYGLLVYGHTHKIEPVQQVWVTGSVPAPYFYANPGCLRDLKPVYVKRKRTHLWGQGMVVGECDNVRAIRKSIAWSAETLVFSDSGLVRR